jgi:hypothetical protein
MTLVPRVQNYTCVYFCISKTMPHPEFQWLRNITNTMKKYPGLTVAISIKQDLSHYSTKKTRAKNMTKHGKYLNTNSITRYLSYM